MNKKSGFTLVEIMFAVAIIGLLASLGAPAILHTMETAKKKTRKANLVSIEKAKSMLTLPSLIYARGRSLPEGAVFGKGDYTEEALMACIQNINKLDELTVGDLYLIPGDIGTKPHYTKTRPAYSEN